MFQKPLTSVYRKRPCLPCFLTRPDPEAQGLWKQCGKMENWWKLLIKTSTKRTKRLKMKNMLPVYVQPLFFPVLSFLLFMCSCLILLQVFASQVLTSSLYSVPKFPFCLPLCYLGIFQSKLLNLLFATCSFLQCRIVSQGFIYWCVTLQLVGGWATPLKNMSSSIGMMTETQY